MQQSASDSESRVSPDPDGEGMWSVELLHSHDELPKVAQAATVDSLLSWSAVELIDRFVEYYAEKAASIKKRLWDFFRENYSDLSEHVAIYDSGTTMPSYDALEDPQICYQDRFHGGPSVDLLWDAQWYYVGGVGVTFEDGKITNVGIPE